MAMFSTTSAPKPGGSSGGAAPKAETPRADAGSATEKLAAVDISDDAAVEAGDAKPPGASADVFSDGGDDVRVQAVAYAASTFGQGGEHLVTALPAEGDAWVEMLFLDPMPAMVKKAKKEGESQAIQNECKLISLKGVAYLFAKEGAHVATWRSKLEGVEIGTGDRPMVRFCADKMKAVVGKEGAMLKAINAHSSASATMLPTGHLAVRGKEEHVTAAIKLVDNLLDGDGKETRKTLEEHLADKEPWCGELMYPCAEEFVGEG
uniref:K Homology domain-containing protein n=1 Tax=Haptolina brevifila TaxID=156173 RepID=A0A7S2C6W4_9EUKA